MQLARDLCFFDLTRVPKLVTHEDKAYYHAHKTMGVFCMAHYVYRIARWWQQGSMGFAPDMVTLATLVPHFLLHVTSFEFLLSQKRNKSYNIIWPEMRWHSAIFAYRSLLAMLAVLWLPVAHQRLARSLLVLGTMLAADHATAYYKKKELVARDDSTMRGNPYPAYAPPMFRRGLNLFYSSSQVFATMNILCRTPEFMFLVLIPIQTSSFLMTLVRKGFITQAGWHGYYILALLLNFAYGQMAMTHDDHLYRSMVGLFCLLRFGLSIDKYLLWGILIGFLTWKGGMFAPMHENRCLDG